ncbi:hypothetical protein QFZ66_001027 [Streptomyces sp. B4I13]|nr:hypothetical protein [Streptomyces sp. B4I13]
MTRRPTPERRRIELRRNGIVSTSHVRGAVVVGVDATSAAGLALAWAADEAALRRLPPHVVLAVDAPGLEGGSAELTSLWTSWGPAIRTVYATVLEEARDFAVGRHPELTVVAELADGSSVGRLAGPRSTSGTRWSAATRRGPVGGGAGGGQSRAGRILRTAVRLGRSGPHAPCTLLDESADLLVGEVAGQVGFADHADQLLVLVGSAWIVGRPGPVCGGRSGSPAWSSPADVLRVGEDGDTGRTRRPPCSSWTRRSDRVLHGSP